MMMIIFFSVSRFPGCSSRVHVQFAHGLMDLLHACKISGGMESLLNLIVNPLGVILVETGRHDCRLPASTKSKTRYIDRKQRVGHWCNAGRSLLLQLVLGSESIFIDQGVQE